MAAPQTITDLKPKIRAAYLWTTAGNLAKHIVGFGISILLARVLGPSDYGLVGMVTIFIGILSTFQDLGLGQAVVHFDDEEADLPTYYTITLAMGAALTVLAFVSAPLVARFYNEPRLVSILRALSFMLLMAALQAVSTGILSKQFRFKELTVRDVTSTLGAGAVAVGLAFMGFGAWSLVINLLLYSAIQTVLVCWMIPPRFTTNPKREIMPRLMRYGGPLTTAAVLHQLYESADTLIIGKLLGATLLGYYSMSFRLATLAHEKITVIINRVAFPSFAAMKKDTEHLVEHWFDINWIVALINFPLLVYLFVNASDLLVFLVGDKWLPAATPLRWLCVVGILRSLVHIVLHIYNALGRTDLRLQFGILNTILLPTGFFIGCKLRGLEGVGMAWAMTYPLILVFVLAKAKKLVSFTIPGYVWNLRIPILLAVAAAVTMGGAHAAMQPGRLRLGASSAAGALSCLAIVAVDGGTKRKLRALWKSRSEDSASPPVPEKSRWRTARLDESTAADYDRFIRAHPLASYEHRRETFRIGAQRWNAVDRTLLVYDEAGVVGVLPLLVVRNRVLRHVPSVSITSGAEFNRGPLLRHGAAQKITFEATRLLLAEARAEAARIGADRIEIYYPNIIGGKAALDRLRYMPLLDHGYEATNRVSFLLDLSQDEEALWTGLDRACRNRIRSAQKQGILTERVETREEWLDCYALNQETLAHTGLALSHDLMNVIWTDFVENGLASVFVCRNDGHVTNVVVITHCNGSGAYWFGFNSKSRHLPGGNRAALWGALLYAKQHGVVLFNLGSKWLPGEDQKFKAISDFKEEFGGEPNTAIGGVLALRPVKWQLIALGRTVVKAVRGR